MRHSRVRRLVHSAWPAVLVLSALAAVEQRPLAAQPPADTPTAAEQPAPPAGTPNETQPPIDRYGDPLPAGALARLGTMRFRHPAAVTMLTTAPSGKEVVTLCQGSSTLRYCDLATGKVSDFFDLGQGFAVVPSGRRTSLYFLDSGKRLIVAAGNLVQAFDVETKKPLWHPKPNLPQAVIFASAVSPDGKRVAIIQSPGRLVVMDTDSGKIHPESPPRAANSPTDIAFTHDGQAVTISTHNQTEGLRSWSVETGKELPPIKDIPNTAMAIAYSPDGKWLAVGHSPPSVTLYDLQAKTPHTIAGFASLLRWVEFTPDGKLLLAYDGTAITVLDTETRKELRKFPVGITQALPSISRDGKTVVTCSANVVDAWNIDTGEPLHSFEGHRSTVSHSAVSPDGRLAATVGQDNTLRVWDLQTSEQIHMRRRAMYAAFSVTFTPDGRRLLWADSPTSIEVLDVAAIAGPAARDKPADAAVDHIRGNQFNIFALSDDGRTLVANNSAGGGTQTWDLTQPNSTAKYVPPTFGAQSMPLAFSPDARLAATRFSVDGSGPQMVVADVARGHEVARLVSNPGQQPVHGVFANSRLLATTSRNHVTLWDVLSGKSVVNVGAAAAPAATTALTCSPDGRLLAWATSDANRTIHLYDSLGGRELGQFTGHAGLVQSLRLHTASDRPVLISGSQDSTALVWDLRPIMDEVRRTTPRLADEPAVRLWADLAAEDALAMHRASWVLSAAGEEAIPVLAERLQPVPIDDALGAKIEKLVAEMDHDLFSVREQASQQAAELGEAAEPYLAEALKTTGSAEARHRIRRLLADITGRPIVLSADQQRALRAVQILEQIGGSQSRAALTRLTQGQPSARLTQEAKSALTRLDEAQKQGYGAAR